jgi:hypothetical protein
VLLRRTKPSISSACWFELLLWALPDLIELVTTFFTGYSKLICYRAALNREDRKDREENIIMGFVAVILTVWQLNKPTFFFVVFVVFVVQITNHYWT